MYGLIALVDRSARHKLSDTDGNKLAAALAAQIRYHVQPHYRQTAAPVVWYGPHIETVPAKVRLESAEYTDIGRGCRPAKPHHKSLLLGKNVHGGST